MIKSTDCTDDVVCPWCLYMYEDSVFEFDGDRDKIKCEYCGREFSMARNISFTTWKIIG